MNNNWSSVTRSLSTSRYVLTGTQTNPPWDSTWKSLQLCIPDSVKWSWEVHFANFVKLVFHMSGPRIQHHVSGVRPQRSSIQFRERRNNNWSTKSRSLSTCEDAHRLLIPWASLMAKSYYQCPWAKLRRRRQEQVAEQCTDQTTAVLHHQVFFYQWRRTQHFCCQNASEDEQLLSTTASKIVKATTSFRARRWRRPRLDSYNPRLKIWLPRCRRMLPSVFGDSSKNGLTFKIEHSGVKPILLRTKRKSKRQLETCTVKVTCGDHWHRRFRGLLKSLQFKCSRWQCRTWSLHQMWQYDYLSSSRTDRTSRKQKHESGVRAQRDQATLKTKPKIHLDLGKSPSYWNTWSAEPNTIRSATARWP